MLRMHLEETAPAWRGNNGNATASESLSWCCQLNGGCGCEWEKEGRKSKTT